MATSIKIQGVPRDHAQPIWSVDNVHWWDKRALIEDARFRKIESAGYIDHVATLSLDEARALAKSQRKRANKLYADRVRELDRCLKKNAPETCWVLISVYEWESGL